MIDAEARVARLEAALRGMLDVQLRSMPGVNLDGSVSTSSMAETLARAALASGSEAHAGVCLRCGSGVLLSGEHVRDDLAPCFGASGSEGGEG